MDTTAAAPALDSDIYVLNHPYARPYWEAAERGVLLVPRCRSCGRVHWYPRPFCPFCYSTDLELLESKGQGTIYGCSTLRRASPPYTVALVTLDEGPTILTNLTGEGADALGIGARVGVSFTPSKEGRKLPVFSRL